MISFFNAEPFGARVEFTEVVERFDFDAEYKADDRWLRLGRAAAPGPRWIGRRGLGEYDRFWGMGLDTEGELCPEKRSSHILTP